jgi:hypothetical protein
MRQSARSGSNPTHQTPHTKQQAHIRRSAHTQGVAQASFTNTHTRNNTIKAPITALVDVPVRCARQITAAVTRKTLGLLCRVLSAVPLQAEVLELKAPLNVRV